MQIGTKIKFKDEHSGLTYTAEVTAATPRTESWQPRGRYDVRTEDGLIMVVHESRMTVIA
jgi:hypothetical protein